MPKDPSLHPHSPRRSGAPEPVADERSIERSAQGFARRSIMLQAALSPSPTHEVTAGTQITGQQSTPRPSIKTPIRNSP